MNRNIVLRIVAGVVLLLALAGIGYFAFQAGSNHAAVSDLSSITASLPERLSRFDLGMGRGGLFLGGFFLLRCLGGLLLLALVFGAFRVLFWGPRWGMRPPMHWGPHWQNGEGMQERFNEWHRKAHEPTDQQQQ